MTAPDSLRLKIFLLAATLCVVSPAGAGQPSANGETAGSDGASVAARYFSDRHRALIREHYAGQFRRGICAPGLERKAQGCTRVEPARKWAVGQPLPREVIFSDLPPALIVQLGRPRVGFRYVQVAGDVLLLALGTGVVVDAVLDQGRM